MRSRSTIGDLGSTTHAQTGIQLVGGVGHERRKEQSADTAGLKRVVQNESELRKRILGFSKVPRRRFLDIEVCAVHKLHDHLGGTTEIDLLKACRIAIEDAVRNLLQGILLGGEAIVHGRDHPVKVLHSHVGNAAEQVAVGIRKIGVVHLKHTLKPDVAVGTEGNIAHEVITVSVYAERGHKIARIQSVALGLGHLGAVGGHKEAMRENVLGQRQASSHEHCRPNNAMEADDVLANEMEVGRPVLAELGFIIGAVAQGGQVIDQSIDPHIGDMLGVEGQRNTPVES